MRYRLGATPTLPFPRQVVLAVTVLTAGCFTEPCDCPPGTSSLVFYGDLRSAAGQPQEGAAITVSLTTPACAFPPSDPSALTATTGSDGRFRTGAERGEAGAEVCVRITAHRVSDGQLIVTTEGLRAHFPRALDGIDSVEIVLQASQ